MQKLLKRVATAERVTNKRRTTRNQIYERNDYNDRLADVALQRKDAFKDIQRAKQAIRDDWHLGPLAPKPNYGELGDAYGAVAETRYKITFPMKDKAKEERCKWLGGTKNLNLASGDRVVLLEGPDKGKIGKVMEVDLDDFLVTVEGLNKSNVKLPKTLTGEGRPPGINLELAMPVSAVRLVHPIRDPVTGEVRDVIINQLRHGPYVTDGETGKSRWSRIVPGLNVAIPWPAAEPESHVDHKIDTLRIDVEERTFVPTLLQPPMPEGLIDELRNKYSRFRTRHEPAYLARKEAEEQAKRDRAGLIVSMRTPLQDFHRAERERKKRKGKPRLTLEMLEVIGRVIAKNRERTLNAAGVSHLSSPATEMPPASEESVAPPQSA